MANMRFSELTTASVLADSDIFALAKVDAGSASGYMSYKDTMIALANYIGKSAQFNVDLQTTAKNIVGAINEVKNLAELIPQFDIEVVQTLPVSDISETTLYLVPSDDPEVGNAYDEFIYVNNTWELVGSTAVDLSAYYNKTEVDALLATKANSADVTAGLALKEDKSAMTSDVTDIVQSLVTPTNATITDGIAQFTTIEANPLKGLKADITPIQDLHGYDNPWVGGAGTNKWDEEWELGALNTTTGAETTPTNQIRAKNYIEVNPSTQYYIKADSSVWVMFFDANKDVITDNLPPMAQSSNNARRSNNQPFTTPPDCAYIRFYFQTSYGTTYNYDTAVNYPATVTTYAPYSNICPIYGHTQEVITNTDGDETTETYTIDLNGTRYGGTLDVTEGVLTVTDGYIAEYNGETLPSTWISDRDVYAPNTTPTTGAEVVYKLATPTTVTLTPTQITALAGENNVSASTGAVSECKYTKMHTWDDIKAYIDSQMGE